MSYYINNAVKMRVSENEIKSNQLINNQIKLLKR